MSFITSGLLGGLLITGGFTPDNSATATGGVSFGAARPWYADYAGSGEGGLKVGASLSNSVAFGPSPSGGTRLSGYSTVVYSPVGSWTSTIIVGGLGGQALATGGFRLGFNTYTIVGVGGERFGGAAGYSRSAAPSTTGGFSLGGSTDGSLGSGLLLRQIIVSGLLDGTLVTGGFLEAGEINIEFSTGGFRIGGVGSPQYATVRPSSGGVQFSGFAPTNFPSLMVGVGGSRLGGTATVREAVVYSVVGGTKFGGTVLVAVPNPQIAAPRMIIAARIL